MGLRLSNSFYGCIYTTASLTDCWSPAYSLLCYRPSAFYWTNQKVGEGVFTKYDVATWITKSSLHLALPKQKSAFEDNLYHGVQKDHPNTSGNRKWEQLRSWKLGSLSSLSEGSAPADMRTASSPHLSQMSPSFSTAALGPVHLLLCDTLKPHLNQKQMPPRFIAVVPCIRVTFLKQNPFLKTE